MKLSGNTILLTGGSSGIGFELARQLVQRGNKLVVTGRDQDKLDRAKQKVPELSVIKSDVSQVADVEALYAVVRRDHPEVNVLINNAGVWRQLDLNRDDESLESLTREIDVNFAGPVRMIKRFLGHLKGKPGAAIVNVSSCLAFVPLAVAPIYCATKAALHSYTLSLRVQMKKTGVKVFEIMPPTTDTEMIAEMTAEDRKGVAVMKVEDMVTACIEGLEADRFEIRPGQSNQLRFMSRLAPGFILAQLSKPVERMLAQKK